MYVIRNLYPISRIPLSNMNDSVDHRAAWSFPNFALPSDDQPPVYRFNLSLPPRFRHYEICRNYKAEFAELIPLFHEILEETPFPRFVNLMAKLILKGVRSTEESEEMRGIAEATGLPHHLVVAFNMFPDLFTGCTSGGVKVNDAGARCEAEGIVHFRSLDWDMNVLRKLLVCVEYVRNDEVIAR
jgi:beta subunit of N-acylethanolamine-hydrolyzing acid amidase